MKVYRYEAKAYNCYGRTQTLNGLFIPEQGVIEYTSEEQICFFSGDLEIIERAQMIVEGKGEGKYLGEIELPDEELMQVVSLGKSLNQARENFRRNVKSLIEKIE